MRETGRNAGRRSKSAGSILLGAALLLLGQAPHAAAFEKGLSFRIGVQPRWPPITFGEKREKEKTVEKLLHASLQPAAWERAAPKVRGIATGDSRAGVEADLGLVTHNVEDENGAISTVKIANGYIDAISGPRTMQFGLLDHRLVIRKWIVHFDAKGNVSETEVFPDGSNDRLLAEPKIPDDAGHGPMSTPFDVDYLLASRRGASFISPEGWARVKPGLEKLKPGDSRFALEEAANFRYYLLHLRAWPMADGYLPMASTLADGTGRETMAFGWAEHYEPIVKARVILADDVIQEIRFEP